MYTKDLVQLALFSLANKTGLECNGPTVCQDNTIGKQSVTAMNISMEW